MGVESIGLLRWSQTGTDDLLTARYALDGITDEAIEFNLNAQKLGAYKFDIVPRLARVAISGAFNYVIVDLDGVARVFRRQGIFSIRLAGQSRLRLTARTRGAAAGNVSVTFYNADEFANYSAADIYFRDGFSGEPLSIVYNANVYINAGLFKWHPSGTAPFNNNLDVRIPVEVRPENAARFDEIDLTVGNGRILSTVRGRFNGGANTLRSFIHLFGFDETDPRYLASQAGPPDIESTYYWFLGSGGTWGNKQGFSPRAISGIGGRGRLMVAMRRPRNNATGVQHPIGTNVAQVNGTITLQMY